MSIFVSIQRAERPRSSWKLELCTLQFLSPCRHLHLLYLILQASSSIIVNRENLLHHLLSDFSQSRTSYQGAEGVGSEFVADAHAVAAVGGQEWYDYAEPEGKTLFRGPRGLRVPPADQGGVPEEAVDPHEWDKDEGFDF
uniref:Uncharacterized protein n=1 Tax=Leersia perrieri TaxID=77586 RepID=A0A0D9VYB0_9ORYZ